VVGLLAAACLLLGVGLVRLLRGREGTTPCFAVSFAALSLVLVLVLAGNSSVTEDRRPGPGPQARLEDRGRVIAPLPQRAAPPREQALKAEETAAPEGVFKALPELVQTERQTKDGKGGAKEGGAHRNPGPQTADDYGSRPGKKGKDKGDEEGR